MINQRNVASSAASHNRPRNEQRLVRRIITRFPLRTKPEEPIEINPSARTSETLKVSLLVLNAPLKPSRTSKKVDMRPKRFQFMKETENSSSVDSGICSNESTRRYPLRANRNKVLENLRPSSSKGKQLQSTGSSSRKNCPNIDKENDASLANSQQNKSQFELRNETSSKTINWTLTASPNPLNPEERAIENEGQLSQCDPNSTWREKLEWLQPRRDIGLWVQCCRETCGKWRYLQDIHDPIDVPDIWYCEMLSNPRFASCDYPEEQCSPAIIKDTIENKYNAGSIVWAQLTGYPWWPAMIDDSPDTFLYYQLKKNSNVPNKYNVTYFEDDKVRYSWIPVRNLRPYKNNPKEVFLKRKKLNYRGVNYKDPLNQACKIADEAMPLSLYDRLKRFSFVARWSENGKTTNAETTNRKRSNTRNPVIAPERSSLRSIVIVEDNVSNDNQMTAIDDEVVFIGEMPSQSSKNSAESDRPNERIRPVFPDERCTERKIHSHRTVNVKDNDSIEHSAIANGSFTFDDEPMTVDEILQSRENAISWHRITSRSATNEKQITATDDEVVIIGEMPSMSSKNNTEMERPNKRIRPVFPDERFTKRKIEMGNSLGELTCKARQHALSAAEQIFARYNSSLNKGIDNNITQRNTMSLNCMVQNLLIKT